MADASDELKKILEMLDAGGPVMKEPPPLPQGAGRSATETPADLCRLGESGAARPVFDDLARRLEEEIERFHAASDPAFGSLTLVDLLFEKGRTFFREGRFGDALESWSDLAVHLDNSGKVQEWIDGVRRRLPAGEAGLSAGAVTENENQATADPFFERAESRLQAEQGRVDRENARLEAAADEKKAQVESILRQAGEFFERQEWDRALTECRKALPLVDRQDVLGRRIEDLQKACRGLLKAKEALKVLEKKVSRGVPVPAEGVARLDRVASVLRGESERVRSAERGPLSRRPSSGLGIFSSRPVLFSIILFLISLWVLSFSVLRAQRVRVHTEKKAAQYRDQTLRLKSEHARLSKEIDALEERLSAQTQKNKTISRKLDVAVQSLQEALRSGVVETKEAGE